MGHWLDALAKSTAIRRSHRTTHVELVADEAGRPLAATPSGGGMTRRDILVRAGVVGVAWTIPTVLSAQAPAAAASGGACNGVCGGVCPPCTAGTGPCTTNSQCASGTICVAGLCKIPYGGTTPCTGSPQCQSGNCSGTTGSPGTCLASWPGTTCTADSQCLSNKCNGGKCFENSLGGNCRTSADCTDNVTCSATTQTCGGLGATCSNNNKCVSGRCRNGVCAV